MSTTIRWIGVKFGADIRGPQRINGAHFGDRLTFNFQTTWLANYGFGMKPLNSESEESEYLTRLERLKNIPISDIILIWKSTHRHNILQSHSCSSYSFCQFILLLNWGNLTSACAKNKYIQIPCGISCDIKHTGMRHVDTEGWRVFLGGEKK